MENIINFRQKYVNVDTKINMLLFIATIANIQNGKVSSMKEHIYFKSNIRGKEER